MHKSSPIIFDSIIQAQAFDLQESKFKLFWKDLEINDSLEGAMFFLKKKPENA